MTAADWIGDGEKYALVALSLQVDSRFPVGPIGPNLWLYSSDSFQLPAHWTKWMGSIRAGELQRCNVFLLSKTASETPSVLDGETKQLQHHALTFYYGLLLASRFAPMHRPVLLTGSRHDGTIDVRQLQDFDRPAPCTYRGHPGVCAGELTLAARLAKAIDDIPATAIRGGHWRLFRALHIYLAARTEPNWLERLHQYCRSLEGLIGADAGKSKRHFKSRTELFIGPSHHELMGAIYEIRSDVEHLHEDRHLLSRDRAKRLDFVQKEAVIENLVRRVLSTILSDPKLWEHFANRDAISVFWTLRAAERSALWGPAFDINEPLASFDPKRIRDEDLGLE